MYHDSKSSFLGVTNYDDDHQVIDDTRPSSHFYPTSYPVHRNATLHETQHRSRQSLHNDTNNQHDGMYLFKRPCPI